MRRFWLGLVLGALLLPLGTLGAAALGLMGTDTAPNPPLWEAKLARLAFTRSVARHADSIPNPVPPSEDQLRVGLRIYSGNCGECHGFPNHPSSFGLSFYPRAKQFAETSTLASRLAELLDHDSRDPADRNGGLGERALRGKAVAGGDVCERAGSLTAGGG